MLHRQASISRHARLMSTPLTCSAANMKQLHKSTHAKRLGCAHLGNGSYKQLDDAGVHAQRPRSRWQNRGATLPLFELGGADKWGLGGGCASLAPEPRSRQRGTHSEMPSVSTWPVDAQLPLDDAAPSTSPGPSLHPCASSSDVTPSHSKAGLSRWSSVGMSRIWPHSCILASTLPLSTL
jgi:hypothetical protein